MFNMFNILKYLKYLTMNLLTENQILEHIELMKKEKRHNSEDEDIYQSLVASSFAILDEKKRLRHILSHGIEFYNNDPVVYQQIINYLVDIKKVDINKKGAYGWHPLSHCIHNGDNLVLVEYFLNKGANINQTNQLQCSHNYDVQKYLLEHGSDVNMLDDGEEPMIYHTLFAMYPCDAPEYELTNYEVIRIIDLYLEYGYDINKYRDYDNKSPLAIAIEKNNYEICKYLVDHGAKIEDNILEEFNILMNNNNFVIEI